MSWLQTQRRMLGGQVIGWRPLELRRRGCLTRKSFTGENSQDQPAQLGDGRDSAARRYSSFIFTPRRGSPVPPHNCCISMSRSCLGSVAAPRSRSPAQPSNKFLTCTSPLGATALKNLILTLMGEVGGSRWSYDDNGARNTQGPRNFPQE